MRPHRASFTAAFVAVCRGLSPLLPESARLVTDPYGVRLAGPAGEALVSALASGHGALRALSWVVLWPMLPWVIYMQVRTRALDDALLRFVEEGGRQVVIPGAGFDARALRLRERLGETVVFEVDHPATQARKRELFGESSNVRALAWDFEQDPMSELPGRLATLGHDRTSPTFTLWEGVTMYLTREAIGATLAAVRDFSAPGSRLAFNYVERRLLEGSSPAAALVTGFVAAVGEPFRSGFSEQELAALLREHGFAVQEDRSFEELSQQFLGAPWSWAVREGKRLALVERTATAVAS